MRGGVPWPGAWPGRPPWCAPCDRRIDRQTDLDKQRNVSALSYSRIDACNVYTLAYS